MTVSRQQTEQGFSAVQIQFPFTLPAHVIQTELSTNRLQLIIFNVDADDLLQGDEGLASVPEKRNRFRASIAQTLAYAEILKPAAINILPGRCLDKNRHRENIHTFKQNLAYALEIFFPLGIKPIYEVFNT